MPVKVKEIEIEQNNELLSYIGIVNSDLTKKYSFKSAGKIDNIYVASGQYVEKENELISIDKTDLQLQANAAKSQMDAAYAQYEKALNGALDEDIRTAELNVEKAQASYDFASKTYNDMKTLFEQGAVSESKLKESELSFKVAESELEQVKEQYEKSISGTRNEDIDSSKAEYEAAKIVYDTQIELVENAVIKSDVNGYIVDILYEKGEIISAGYPVIVVRSEVQVVNIGVSQKDVKNIEEGLESIVEINNEKYKGIVSSIDQTPDATTKTFNVEIALEEYDDKIYMGSTARVKIIIGIREGIWVDIPYILSDDQNYVYICKNDRAIRKNVTLGSIFEDKVYVDGLAEGDLLIIKGIKNLKDGYKVVITE